jgi:hypothetical protein
VGVLTLLLAFALSCALVVAGAEKRTKKTGDVAMATRPAADKRPFWLMIEDQIVQLADNDLSGGSLEQTIQRTAKALDDTGINVSRNAGNLLQLRRAVDARIKVGRPLLQDFNGAVSALSLEDVADTRAAAWKIIREVGEAWPKLRESERKPAIISILERTKFDLSIARAKELGGEPGIRFLLGEQIAPSDIIEAMGVSQEEFDRVNAAVEAERAERARVISLLGEVADKTDDEKVKHLLDNEVADDLILELAGVEQSALDGAKKAMEAELAEKKRLAEEEAARKKAEAEGPPLEDIPADEMLEYIESIRQILDFSDVEDEIRTMCEQSSIPKALVEIAVSDTDRLDELESQAEAG